MFRTTCTLFVCLLRALASMDYQGMPAYNLIFRIERTMPGTPKSHVQKQLLKPFRQLSGTVKIPNDVETDYWQDLTYDMTFKVQWTRLAAWQLYAHMVSFIGAAEEAIQERKLRLASLNNSQAHRSLRRCNPQKPQTLKHTPLFTLHEQ